MTEDEANAEINKIIAKTEKLIKKSELMVNAHIKTVKNNVDKIIAKTEKFIKKP